MQPYFHRRGSLFIDVVFIHRYRSLFIDTGFCSQIRFSLHSYGSFGQVSYGVATISRLLKNIGLFCRISSLLQGSFAKETYNFKEPTHRSHPIQTCANMQVPCVCSQVWLSRIDLFSQIYVSFHRYKSLFINTGLFSQRHRSLFIEYIQIFIHRYGFSFDTYAYV